MPKLLDGARIVVKKCMHVKRGEIVLVVTDKPRLKIAKTLVEAAREMGAKPILLCMQVGKRHGEEPPKLVAIAMREADVVLAPTTYSLTHTQARHEACKYGARIATMPMITEEMMRRGAMLADYDHVKKLTMRLAKLLDETSEVEVTTRAGTNLIFSTVGRKAHPDTGIFHMPGDFGNLPAGEAFIAPVEGTAQGKIIVDGSMLDLINSKIEILVKNGVAVKISGSRVGRLIKMLNGVGPKAYNIAEFGIGTNPKARLIGNVLEDEKVLGTCHFALGDNSTFGGKIKAGVHIDGILLKPTINLDGKMVMREGKLLLD